MQAFTAKLEFVQTWYGISGHALTVNYCRANVKTERINSSDKLGPKKIASCQYMIILLLFF